MPFRNISRSDIIRLKYKEGDYIYPDEKVAPNVEGKDNIWLVWNPRLNLEMGIIRDMGPACL